MIRDPWLAAFILLMVAALGGLAFGYLIYKFSQKSKK
jgi:hypothetical protein